MIAGVGTDLCAIPRMRAILEREGETGPFFRKTFTEAERREAAGRHNKAEFYAARFAAKEAVSKALRCETELRSIECLHRPDGSPYVALNPEMRALGITEIYLSISHERDYAIAFVVAERDTTFDNI